MPRRGKYLLRVGFTPWFMSKSSLLREWEYRKMDGTSLTVDASHLKWQVAKKILRAAGVCVAYVLLKR
jgi:hypothetical protein